MIFDDKSRYANRTLRTVIDGRGRPVTVVTPHIATVGTLLGYHLLREGERLDHLAALYLKNPHLYWAICDQNDAMNAEQLTERDEIAIPTRGGS